MIDDQITQQQTTLREQYNTFKENQEAGVLETILGVDTEKELLEMLDNFDKWTASLAMESRSESQKSLQDEIQEILSVTMSNFFRDKPSLHRASFQVVCDEQNNPPHAITDSITFAIAIRFIGLGIIITLLRSHTVAK